MRNSTGSMRIATPGEDVGVPAAERDDDRGDARAIARSHLLDLMAAAQSELPAKGRELVALGKHLLRSGFRGGHQPGRRRGLAAMPRGSHPRRCGRGVQGDLVRLLRAGEGPRSPVKTAEKPGGRKVQVMGESAGRALAWWSEGDDLVVSLVSSSGVDAMVAATRRPRAQCRRSSDATGVAQVRGCAGFDPVGVAFFDMAALPPLPREAAALGLDRIERFDYRWGFDGAAIQGVLGAVVPSPRTGIPALFDQPTFDARHLPPLPGGLSGFIVFSLDAARLYDRLARGDEGHRSPRPAAHRVDQVQAEASHRPGSARGSPGSLGSRVVLYTVPSRINAPPNVLAGVAHALLRPQSTVVFEVKDREGGRAGPGSDRQGGRQTGSGPARSGIHARPSRSIRDRCVGSRGPTWDMCSRPPAH